MSIASNLVSNISGELQGIKTGQKTAADNNVFEDLLQKQLNGLDDFNPAMQNDGFAIPSGLNIGDLDGSTPIFELNQNNPSEKINTINKADNFDFSNAKDFSASEILAFFPSLFDSKPTLTNSSDNGLFNLERKIAASSYGKYAKNLVTDLQDFVTDTIKSKL